MKILGKALFENAKLAFEFSKTAALKAQSGTLDDIWAPFDRNHYTIHTFTQASYCRLAS